MISMGNLSPAGIALTDYGGGLLTQQRDQETEELRKRRLQMAQSRAYSPAGATLVGSGAMSVPGTL
jgi:hypothetical protein